MSDMDVLMLGKKLEHQAKTGKAMSQALEAELVADYKAKFFLKEPEEHEDPISEGKKELGAYQLKVEANAVRENLSGLVEKVSTAVPSLENTRERALQNSGKWDEAATRYFTTPDLKKINVAVPLSGMENFIKDGGTLNVEFNIPDAEYAKELAPFIQHAKQTGMEWSEAQQTQIAELVKYKCMVKYQPELLSQATKMGIEKAYKGWVAETTNTKKPVENAPKINQQPRQLNTNDESDRLAAALNLV
jgi:hypothetical protein